MSYQWTIAGVSDTGKKRKNNEDSIGWITSQDDQYLCAVVADGMGGHAAGEVASSIARTLFIDFFDTFLQHTLKETEDEDFIGNALLECIERIHQSILERGARNPAEQGMGTTLTGIIARQQTLWVINIGDSRCYTINNKNIQQLTKDHSVLQEWLDKQQSEEGLDARYRNVLTQALGAKKTIKPDLIKLELQPNTTLLLCSDGLTACLDDVQIERTIGKANELSEQTQLLLDESLAAGAPDNVSLILAEWVDSSTES
ncbi:PP2C family serine/threonine-protein phosphatase [Pleionea sp. CnH1-48]|uniref:PP2C family protein-serine/threonine phosphatase n=1 Tax=Pleionea sp. CnH1-48 TaxID=2954494 RepID=UPI0020971A86|nr:protein phosphatase 2C domain-containing protein [Pleionea sp. CnH1-48]MCO7225181.1 protein phosphatase 2C domain-containing protein [Pleionea sp. CnH1-48]